MMNLLEKFVLPPVPYTDADLDVVAGVTPVNQLKADGRYMGTPFSSTWRVVIRYKAAGMGDPRPYTWRLEERTLRPHRVLRWKDPEPVWRGVGQNGWAAAREDAMTSAWTAYLFTIDEGQKKEEVLYI
jgi:hypothetical protein